MNCRYSKDCHVAEFILSCAEGLTAMTRAATFYKIIKQSLLKKQSGALS